MAIMVFSISRWSSRRRLRTSTRALSWAADSGTGWIPHRVARSAGHMEGMEKKTSALMGIQDSPSLVRTESFHWRSVNPLPTTMPISAMSFLYMLRGRDFSHISYKLTFEKPTVAAPQTILKVFLEYTQNPLLVRPVPSQ